MSDVWIRLPLLRCYFCNDRLGDHFFVHDERRLLCGTCAGKRDRDPRDQGEVIGLAGPYFRVTEIGTLLPVEDAVALLVTRAGAEVVEEVG